MKNILTRSDFTKPFPTLSPNAPEAQIADCVWRAQDCNLRDAIGSDLYADFMRIYEIEKSVINVIVGTQTIITLDNVVGLEVGYSVSFKDLQGTIANSINGLWFEILAISGNAVTIGLDSTAKTWTSGGLLERVLTPAYKELYPYMQLYLIYLAYAFYIPVAPIQSTNSGLMNHTVGEATHLTDKQRGETVNQYSQTANTYRQRLLEFLQNNATAYPLFTFAQSSTIANPIFFGKKSRNNGNKL